MKRHLLLLAATGCGTYAFSIHDDLLAFPQYEVVFSDSYILGTDAESQLANAATVVASAAASLETPSALSARRSDQDEYTQADHSVDDSNTLYSYEYMVLNSLPYLCTIPQISTPPRNETTAKASKADEEKELARATERGWELIKDLEGHCLYFISGWWSYSFCYNTEVKQFHQLPPGRNGIPIYPPVEDEGVPSFILGQYPGPDGSRRTVDGAPQQSTRSDGASAATDLVSVHSKGDTRYLVQRLADGTMCDLTGRPRKVEVQYHCHPQSPDRIGYIKEVSTCSYLMVVYTPRLCNDIAFVPPRETQAHRIMCEEIVAEAEVEGWQTRKQEQLQQQQLASSTTEVTTRPMIGDIELGGMKTVGQPGQRIEPPKVFQPSDERAEIVARWDPGENDGKVQRLSNEDLKEMDLDLAAVKQMSEELQKMAKGKPWRLEVADAPNGIRELRGIVDDGQDDNADEEAETGDEGQEGSEEVYRDEL